MFCGDVSGNQNRVRANGNAARWEYPYRGSAGVAKYLSTRIYGCKAWVGKLQVSPLRDRSSNADRHELSARVPKSIVRRASVPRRDTSTEKYAKKSLPQSSSTSIRDLTLPSHHQIE